MFFFLTAFILYGSTWICAASEQDVMFATVLFRHGDRNPLKFSPNDPYKNLSYWPEGLGGLTEEGKRQQYRLGIKLRMRYSHLLSQDYDDREVHTESTFLPRTLMSAQSHLAGLYCHKIEPFEVSIYTTSTTFDNSLFTGILCPKFERLKENIHNDIEYRRLNESNVNLYRYLTEKVGSLVNSFNDVATLYWTYAIEELHNYKLPEWTKEVYPAQMDHVSARSFIVSTWTRPMAQLFAGPFITQLVKNFEEASQGRAQRRKLVIYSAHDASIANILNALEVFKPHNPPFAAVVLFELLKDGNNWNVRISYQGQNLRIPNCGSPCSLSAFKDIYTDFIYEDHPKKCGYKEGETPVGSNLTNRQPLKYKTIIPKGI